jgi:hypothetical protein
VHAYLNTDDARLLCYLVVNDLLPEEGWSDFKGSPREGGYEVRVFRIKKLDPGKYTHPWSIRIERGNGQVMGQGAVKLALSLPKGWSASPRPPSPSCCPTGT